MLDDQHFVSSVDKSNALSIVAGQPSQLRQAFALQLPAWRGIQNILVSGMGGSAIASQFVRDWLGERLPLPLTINRGYRLPAFVGSQTLVVISSYSGNTEETLAALEQARRAKAKVVIMASGGKLLELAKDSPVLQLPAGLQPRMAVLYGVKALATLLQELEILTGLASELQMAADWADEQIGDWVMDTPTANNPAKQLAGHLFGHGIIVYSGPELTAAGRKWKINFNENSKNLAWYSPWPEFNHNEMLGWAHPQQHKLKVIELRSNLDHPELARRFTITGRLLSGRMPEPLVIDAQGGTRLQQLLWTQLLGDFVSIYLAALNKADPLDINMIEKLKKELA